MEAGGKMQELNMTEDEIDRLTKAFRDEKFREMLRDYAEEISDPENKRRYEEEIALLERERGNSVEFIHPKPFRALKTSLNGKQKCFINVCANDKVGQPECKSGVSEDGRRGQCWSLPHSLHPGRQDTDSRGNKVTIYDVIFHPDTLLMASKNTRFMDMVDSTAVQGIQSAFKVTLDKNNMRVLNTKYKGTPQPCVVRKPIPGYKEPAEKPGALAFPYPDEKSPTTSSHPKKPESFHVLPQKTKEPTEPNYTVKYRSFVDLQDYRCSRDSARGPRPKEIVVTIDVPLLRSVTDASLEVRESSLLLESKKPAYKLELTLAYPVDEDKGEAKFYKQRGQLTVRLPVLPSNEACGFPVGPVGDAQSAGEHERGGQRGEEERKYGEEEEMNEERVAEGEDLRQQTRAEHGEEEIRKGEVCLESTAGEEETEREKQVKKGQENVEGERGTEGQKSDMIYESGVKEEELKEQKEDQEREDETVTGNQSNLIDAAGHPQTSDTHEETGETEESVQPEADAAVWTHASNAESSTAAAAAASPAPEGSESSGGARSSGNQEESEAVDEDDRPAERIARIPERDAPPPPAALREVDEDGNEQVISDHSTCAGFTFQNTLMYELD